MAASCRLAQIIHAHSPLVIGDWDLIIRTKIRELSSRILRVRGSR